MKLLNKLKALRNNKKGFTLIEIVIVIVIIAILAAMLVPSMLSWIDSANQRTFMSACSDIKTSVLSAASENYAASKGFTITGETPKTWDDVSTLVGKDVTGAIGAAAPTLGSHDFTVSVTLSGKTISAMTVTDKNYTGTLNVDDNTWSIADAAAAES